jgi:hypothetical protein
MREERLRALLVKYDELLNSAPSAALRHRQRTKMQNKNYPVIPLGRVTAIKKPLARAATVGYI